MRELTEEDRRMREEERHKAYWLKWGPYLSERQWGTVREDYSFNGDAWNYLTHDQARSRAYRWGEDGIAGISDTHQRLCFSLALWNGNDPILKERLFGLTSTEGNHGEDVKECYYYLDNTPSHAYMKYLYKYPQNTFPYEDLIEENRRRGKESPEYELADTGIFEKGYFDVFVEYAKEDPEQICIKITCVNRGDQSAPIFLLPTLWFRNSWSFGEAEEKGQISYNAGKLSVVHSAFENYALYYEGDPKAYFTENQTNAKRLFGVQNASPYTKDSIHEWVLQNKNCPIQTGSKASLCYTRTLDPAESFEVCLVLGKKPCKNFEKTFALRKKEADLFWENLLGNEADPECKSIRRQALAGMLWNKQWYHYIVETWLKGDPGQPKPAESRYSIRNYNWKHVYSDDILSMPDKWEYPWFASWDSCFHAAALAFLSPMVAKRQLLRLTREWYMHPNGQIPAYEWNFSDVNPPVQAWAAWKVYKIEEEQTGKKDLLFLERVFQKLLLNFTWWVNRKDVDGKNVFEGGFLGLDNISVFDRSKPLPMGGTLNQADGTSWMAMFCLNMLQISLELALAKPAYEDIASKFFEHFLYIANAITRIGDKDVSLWNEEDGFFYDVVRIPGGDHFSLKVRSLVGLIPLFAVITIDPNVLERLPGFYKRYKWFLENRADLCQKVACLRTPGKDGRRLIALAEPEKIRRILTKMLDEKEFLGPYGIRSLSAYHREHPFVLHFEGQSYRVDYEPAESTTNLFGGNSNWRGPVWMPMNFLLLDALKQYYSYVGDDKKIECPTASGNQMTLKEIVKEISGRLLRIYREENGKRAVNGLLPEKLREDPHFKDHFLFYEYFHGDTGAGLGASHQTGWTGLVALLTYS